MSKDNIIRSGDFHLDAGDEVNILIKDETGSSPEIQLFHSGNTASDNLWDWILPNYIRNVERDNMNPTSDTPWLVTAHDVGTFIITFDLDLPIEMAGFGTDIKNMWVVHTTTLVPWSSNWAVITNVDFTNKQVTYSSINGNIQVGARAMFVNAFRSFYLNPTSPVVGPNTWASMYVSSGGVWQHSDSTYRMIVNGWDGSHGMTGLFSSPDLVSWTDTLGTYKYHSNTHPFHEAWCVGAATHWTACSPVKIPNSNYYAKAFQGINAGGRGEVGIIIHDEDYNIITMPTAGISVPGYVLDATHHYIPGGMCYHGGKLYLTIEYRNTATLEYTILLCTLDSPSTYVVTAVEEVVPTRIPNSFCSLTVLNPCPFVFNGELVVFFGGENTDTGIGPIYMNHVGGIATKESGSWVVKKESPFIMPSVRCGYSVGVWAQGHIGASFSFIYSKQKLHLFIGVSSTGNDYQVGKFDLDFS